MSYTSISSDKLIRLIGTSSAPALVDVRLDEDFAADPRLIPGAVRRSHLEVQDWASQMTGKSVVVICQKGLKLAEGTAAWLRCGSIAAEVLEGGHLAWTEAELPAIPADRIPKRDGRGRTVWVTRSRPKIDRIACPWLIRRFVDPAAVFLFVAPSEVEAVAERFAAVPFDIENVFWSHRGELCTRAGAVRDDGARRRYGTARALAGGAGIACGLARPVADVRRRSRATERRLLALRRVLSLVPRRDQGDA
jgi:rhodanese-related sulfurtransferase